MAIEIANLVNTQINAEESSKLYAQSAAYNTVNAEVDVTYSERADKAASIFDEMNSLRNDEDITDEQRARLDDIEARQTALLGEAEESYTKSKEKLGSFDFMEGHDANDGGEYYNQLAKLSMGQLLTSDSNGDAAIDYDEYSTQNNKELEGHIDDKVLKEMNESGKSAQDYNSVNYNEADDYTQIEMDYIDSNGDGEISDDEIKALDSNNDGKIQQGEIEFSMLDYNGDGKLSQDELLTMYELADMDFNDEHYAEDGKYTSEELAEAVYLMGTAKFDNNNKEFIDDSYLFFNDLISQ